VNKGTAYIAGPMRGFERFNRPAFDAARDRLERLGWDVVSPADLDREAGLDEMALPDDWDWHTLPKHFNLREAMRRDLAAIVDCDAVAVLPGWRKSTGARAEVEVALWGGLMLLNAETGNPLSETILEEAQRLVYGDRNAAYGHPFDDMGRTAKIWSAILGCDVTAAQVALCMVGVKISRECNRPKRDNRVDGAGYFGTLEMIREREAEACESAS